MFKKIFKVIFVISGVLASVWKVFIKFHWHGQNTTEGPLNAGLGTYLDWGSIPFLEQCLLCLMSWGAYKIWSVVHSWSGLKGPYAACILHKRQQLGLKFRLAIQTAKL